MATALLLAMAAFVAGRGSALTPMPSARQLTFRRGVIQSGRFAPDGRTIVYSAAWEGRPPEIFTTTSDGPESRSLGLAPAIVASVSSAGELALLRSSDPQPPDAEPGATLARVPLAGGAPRDLLEDVEFADWAPDGRSLCVVRRVQGHQQVELPPGKILYRSSQAIGWPRVSPRGDRVAFVSWEGAGAAERSRSWMATGRRRSSAAFLPSTALPGPRAETKSGLRREARHRPGSCAP